jgi:hypothetical protein
MRGRDALAIGRDTVDVAPLVQLVDPAQARAAGDAIIYAVERDFINGQASVAEVLDRVFADIETSGLGVLATRKADVAEYAMPRRHEVGAILNRLRSLQVRTRRPKAEGVAAAPAPAGAPVEPGALAVVEPSEAAAGIPDGPDAERAPAPAGSWYPEGVDDETSGR